MWGKESTGVVMSRVQQGGESKLNTTSCSEQDSLLGEAVNVDVLKWCNQIEH